MCSSVSALTLSPLVLCSVLICWGFHSRSFPLLNCFLSFPHRSTEESGCLPRAAEESGESQGKSSSLSITVFSLFSSTSAVFVEVHLLPLSLLSPSPVPFSYPLLFPSPSLSCPFLFSPLSLPPLIHLSSPLFQTEDYLKRKIRSRPERSELVRMHILEGESQRPLSDHHRTTPSHATSRRGYIEPTIPRLFVLLYIHKYV